MKVNRYLLVLTILVALAGCESKTFLRSEKKLKSDIQGHWRPISGISHYGTSVYPDNVQWYFNNGTIQIVYVDANGKDNVYDQATYSINTKVDNSFLTISDFTTVDYHNSNPNSYGFDITWTIIQLNATTLDIAGRPHDGGLVELEFEKK